MCVRYRLISSPEDVRRLLGTVNDEVFPPREMIAPAEPVLIGRIDHRGQRRLDLVRWGLLPAWVKDPAGFPLLINARSEDALDKPTYRAGLRYRRCLVPADGYYQWTGPKGRRRPFLVTPRSPGPIAFAAIWDHWLGADGSELESMSILTVAANDDVRALHDRMPVVLDEGQFAAWLDCRGVPAKDAIMLLRPVPPGRLHASPLAEAAARIIPDRGADE